MGHAPSGRKRGTSMGLSHGDGDTAGSPARRGLVVVHGGAGDEPTERLLTGLHNAASAGERHLAGSPVDAVVAAVAALEADSEFNAGRGAAFNALGECEADASLVDGASGRWAGVGVLRDTVHPVRVAHKLLLSGAAALLVGDGAERFARDNGWPAAELRTPRRREQWQRTSVARSELPSGADAVGSIAVHNDGRIAAAASGGGLAGKPRGRVDATAVVGAGLFADADTAVVCTGGGEAALTSNLALRAASRCRADGAAATAGWAISAAAALHADIGIVIYDHRRGEVAVRHDTAPFAVVVRTGGHSVLLTASRGQTRLWSATDQRVGTRH